MIIDNATFINGSASEIIDIVRELRHSGLVQGTDFDFVWQPASWDYNHAAGAMMSKGGTFAFKDPKWATIFRMKYGSR